MPKTATKRPLSPVERAVERQKMLALLGYQNRALSQGKSLWNAGKGLVNEGLGSLISGAEYAGDRSVTKDVSKDINRLGKMVAQNAGGYADAGNALWQMVKGDGKQAVPDYYRNKAGNAYQEQFNPSPADPRLERFGNFYADPLAVGFGTGRAARGLADPKLYRQIAEDMARGGRSAMAQDGLLGKMVAPQDEALRVAQQNAAKPVEEGGLGLRPDNTPEERAAAMGFDTPAYHGRYRDYSAVKDSRTFYASQDPEYASIYTDPSASSMGGKSMGDFDNTTPNVMPVMLRSGDILDTRTPQGRDVFDNQFYMQYGNGSPLTERGVPDWVDAEDFGEMYADTGSPYKGVWADEGGVPMPDGSVKLRGLSAAIFDPRAIRSRFAAFDPMRRDSSDLLAGIAPFGAIPWLRDEEP